MWHCPHCGAPQAETARCWVCRRSSTTCSTCRHFRASLAADLNYCALDRRRRPLTGLELRGCWAERQPAVPSSTRLGGGHEAAGAAAGSALQQAAPARGFVPIEDVGPRRTAASVPLEVASAGDGNMPLTALGPVEGWEGRTSLFGEPER